MPRRERWSILAATLRAIEEENALGTLRITAVAARANLPHERLQNVLQDLQAAGLVEPTDGKLPRVTERGREYLRRYAEWMENLSRFGLE